jgi:hypoxanthine-DNA glycosylase
MSDMEQVEHTFKPVFDEKSKVLILGTLPSVKSREGGFYYHHPQNRFWKVIAALTKEELPKTVEEKKSLLIRNHIAVWDVIKSCEIEGSSDSSIKNVIPNPIAKILEQAPIERIYGNGDKAYKLYMKYCYKELNKEIIKLPSTSPANATFSMERLLDSWSVILSDKT